MQVEHLFDYHPSREGTNPKHTGTSVQLVKFKRGDSAAIHFFTQLIKAKLTSTFPPGTPFSVVTVPSSTQGKAHNGFTHMVRLLRGSFPVRNNGNLLQRIKSIHPLHKGGSRTKSVHRESLSVSTNIIPNEKVVLLDDVTTSGNSLIVASELLRKAGANVVLVLALGRTVKHEHS